MPQRFLRPGITTSQRFNAITYDAQSLFLRLMTLVDDFGRYDADFRLLRSHAFPYGDPSGKEIKLQTIENMCAQLSAGGLAIFYRASGKQILQLLRWEERPRAQKSKYEDFTDSCEQMFANDSKCMPPSPSSSPLHHRHSTNGSGKQNTSEPSDEDWIKELSQSEAYQGIHVSREHAKMVVWCREHKKQPTRRRFIRWLNKAERPMTFAPKVSPLDKSRLPVPERFKAWVAEHYPDKRETAMRWQTWADVPNNGLRDEWWKQEKAKLPGGVGAMI